MIILIVLAALGSTALLLGMFERSIDKEPEED